MRKRYKESRYSALEQIINKQQEEIETLRLRNKVQATDIDNWKNKAVNNEFVIDSMQKESDQYVLTCKFLTDTLLLLGQLEKLLIKNYSIFSQSLQTAIASFKVKLSKAMQTVNFDGEDSYTFDPYINDNNSENDD